MDGYSPKDGLNGFCPIPTWRITAHDNAQMDTVVVRTVHCIALGNFQYQDLLQRQVRDLRRVLGWLQITMLSPQFLKVKGTNFNLIESYHYFGGNTPN